MSKSSDVKVTLNGETVSATSSVKYLGCILESRLDGNIMAYKVLGKVSGLTKFLARTSRLLDRESMLVLANSLILSHFDFASTSWFESLTKLLKGDFRSGPPVTHR